MKRDGAVALLRRELGREENARFGRLYGKRRPVKAATISLVLLACGSGAYNVSTVPLVAEGNRIAPARFDRMESGWENVQPVLINAGWDEATASLSSFAKARGLGDCGTAQTYVWDGAMFRLVEQSEMGECRGSTDYITTWRAAVRR